MYLISFNKMDGYENIGYSNELKWFIEIKFS